MILFKIHQRHPNTNPPAQFVCSDGQTHGVTDGQHENIIPSHFDWSLERLFTFFFIAHELEIQYRQAFLVIGS